MRKALGKAAGIAALALGVVGQALGAPCLTNPSATVGNPIFGATVQTFINLGINPNVTCIENGLWQDPAGFQLGTFIKGAEAQGGTPDPTALGFNGATTGIGNGNGRDFFWVQDNGNTVNFGNNVFGGRPSEGLVWDLGGQANQAVVFVQVDHGPVPQEVLENTAWLSNDANAADAGWTQAFLTHVYGAGWSPDPDIADGFVAVYTLPNAATFRFVSVTHGGPGAIHRDGDNEIDAVGGLTVAGCGVNDPRPQCQGQGPGNGAPEPASLSLLGLGLMGLAFGRRRNRANG
jgi:PEP-CTERM motif-containing protein